MVAICEVNIWDRLGGYVNWNAQSGIAGCEAIRIMEEVEAAVRKWPIFALESGVDKSIIKHIESTHLFVK